MNEPRRSTSQESVAKMNKKGVLHLHCTWTLPKKVFTCIAHEYTPRNYQLYCVKQNIKMNKKVFTCIVHEHDLWRCSPALHMNTPCVLLHLHCTWTPSKRPTTVCDKKQNIMKIRAFSREIATSNVVALCVDDSWNFWEKFSWKCATTYWCFNSVFEWPPPLKWKKNRRVKTTI